MAQLRIYSKQGVELASFTSSVRNGQIDYLGGGQYVAVNTTGIDQFTIVGESTTNVRTLVTFGLLEDAFGVAVQRRMLMGDVEDSLDPDGPVIYVGMNETISGFVRYAVRQYDLSSATLLSTSILINAVIGVWGDVATNGERIYIAYTDTSVPTPVKHVDLYDVSGAAMTLLADWSVTTTPNAMCHDGLYLWTLESNVIKQYEQAGSAAPVLINSFTPNGTVGNGLCTDGQNLILLSRT